MFDLTAKKKDRKWTDEQIGRANDLAERMMASPNFEGDWAKAFALSRSMENKGFEVKKKPSKPHKKYEPKDKKKKKKKKSYIEAMDSLVKLASVLDDEGYYAAANHVDALLVRVAEATGVKRSFTEDEAREVYDELELDGKCDFKEFHMGMDVELEHGRIDDQTNVTDDDPIMTAKIALAHLNELSNYYTLLKDMEDKGEAMKEKGED